MSGAEIPFIECPLCRARLPMPNGRGPIALTCRFGHRFEWRPAPGPAGRDPVGSLLAAGAIVFAVAALLSSWNWTSLLRR